MSWPDDVTRADLDIQWFSGSGAGGQHRNRHPNCCRMTHIPTGLRAQGTQHKSRERNQRAAFQNLARRLVPMMVPGTERERATERVRNYHEKQGVRDLRLPGRVWSYTDVVHGRALAEILRHVQEEPDKAKP